MKTSRETGTEMKRLTRGSALALLLLALATTTPAQNYFYYSPRPVSSEETGQLKGGVLVREITIRKGDTLSRLSRRFSGKGSYFPQILLFNDIKNPNLIYTGDLLKVPLAKSEAALQHSGEAGPHPKEPAAAEAQPPSPANIMQPVDDRAIKTEPEVSQKKQKSRRASPIFHRRHESWAEAVRGGAQVLPQRRLPQVA